MGLKWRSIGEGVLHANSTAVRRVRADAGLGPCAGTVAVVLARESGFRPEPADGRKSHTQRLRLHRTEPVSCPGMAGCPEGDQEFCDHHVRHGRTREPLAVVALGGLQRSWNDLATARECWSDQQQRTTGGSGPGPN